MNKYNTIDEINNLICEGIDCKRSASEKIIIKAGKYGHISLFLCKNCIRIFKE